MRADLDCGAYQCGVVALVGVAAGVWYIRRVTAPLDRLTSAAEQISQGDLAAPIPRLAGPPELATLSSSLEKSQATMLGALNRLPSQQDVSSSERGRLPCECAQRPPARIPEALFQTPVPFEVRKILPKNAPLSRIQLTTLQKSPLPSAGK